MSDPRAENCKAYKEVGGLVMGVELVYVPVPTSKYQLVKAELIDEPTNGVGGPTVANCVVLDKDNIQTGERVWMAWEWPGMKDGHLLPGNPNGQHMITNGYTPPVLGPLGLYVGDAQHNPISDLIGGVGLPKKHHVSFRFTWKERGSTPEPPDPDNPPVIIDMTSTNNILMDIAKHLGVPGY